MTIEEKVRIEDEIRETAIPLVPEEFLLVVSLVRKAGSCSGNLSAFQVRNEVLRYLNVSSEDVLARCRKREIVYARKLICYTLKHYTRLSLNEIAQMTGYADHTGVIHHLKDLGDLMFTDEKVREHVYALISHIETEIKL